MNVPYRFQVAQLAVCLLSVFGGRQSYGEVETLWTYLPPSGGIDNSPAIADLDGDGSSEVVVTTKSGWVIAVDARGHEIWRREALGRISTPPTIVDVQGDPLPEVLVVNRSGRIFCLHAATGRSIWDWAASAEGDETAIAAADMNADGLIEIVAVDSDGGAVCLSGDGDILWTYTARHGDSKCRCPAIGDLENDGLLEILLSGTQTPLVCLNHDGTERWSLPRTGHGSSPVICDLQGDGHAEIVLGIQTDITALDSRGTVLWKHRMDGQLEHAISVADTNGDGRMEVYVAARSGHFACFQHDGKLQWSTSVGHEVRRSPSIADVDGDGEIEVLIAGDSRSVKVFGASGQLKEQLPLEGRGADSTPTVADLNGDGHLCVVVPIMEGGLTTFQWSDARPGSRVLWPEYRFNAARTAATFPTREQPTVRFASVDFGNCYVGANRFLAEIANPERRALTVRLEIKEDQNAPIRRTVVATDELIKAELAYYITGREAVDLSFTCAVWEDAKPLCGRSYTERVVPFESESADIEASLLELERLIPQLADSQGMRERSHYLTSRLSSLRIKAAQRQELSGAERTTLRSELRDILQACAALRKKVTVAVAAGKSADGPLVISAANPWAPFGDIEEAAEQRIRPASLSVEAFCGEVESAALNLFNFGSQPLTLRVTPTPLMAETRTGKKAVPARHVITLHEVVEVATEGQGQSADALPKLNQAQTIVVPAWAARQLWLNVDTGGLVPGRWKGEINIRSLGVARVQASASLDLNVWDARLPAEHALRLCHWGYVHRSVLSDQPAAALEDQVAHHTNVFVGLIHPQARYDANGKLVGQIDFRAHDEYVKRHAPHGMILFCGYQSALRGPGEHESPAYRQAHIRWLRAWVDHLAELGVGYDGFALYPVDEPGLRPGLVERYLQYARLAREADPKILMYTDPVNTDTSRAITLAELERMAPFVDIWCPNRSGFLLEHRADNLHVAGAQMLDFIKSTGSTVWTYECEGNAKNRCPLGYYRGQAWLAWHHGLTGIGFWSYCTSDDDPWFAPQRSDYLLIYQGEGVVASKRWEAIRDGVEDYSMLALLQDKVAHAAAQGTAAEGIVGVASAILKEEAAVIARYCGRDHEVTEPAIRKGEPAARTIADQRWHRIQETRRRIAAILTEHAGTHGR